MTRQWRAGTPWRARDALDVIAILDTPAWAALLGLDRRMPGRARGPWRVAGIPKLRSIGPSAFEFISENSQIADPSIAFMGLGTLRGPDAAEQDPLRAGVLRYFGARSDETRRKMT